MRDSHQPPLFLQSFAARIREVPLWIRLVLFAAAFGATGYWCVTDSGLYRLLREGPSVTSTEIIFYPRAALYTLGIMLVPVVAILAVLIRCAGLKPAPST